MASVTKDIRPRRSVLYMPGSNARALEKARTLPADALILDLEDSVAPQAKETARRQVHLAVAEGGYGDREAVIRVNGSGTPWGEADLEAAARSNADAVLIPKVQAAGDIAAVRATLDGFDAPQELNLWAMLETPLAVLNVPEIAAAAAGNRYPLTVLVMGANDLAKETRVLATPDREPMLVWMSRCILAARAYDLDILDSVYNDFADLDGLERECRQGRALGFDGKTLIHPSQIAVANAAFAPPVEEVAWARKVIAAFEEPANKGKGVISLDGRMLEILHRDVARRTVALADAIAEKERR